MIKTICADMEGKTLIRYLPAVPSTTEVQVFEMRSVVLSVASSCCGHSSYEHVMQRSGMTHAASGGTFLCIIACAVHRDFPFTAAHV